MSPPPTAARPLESVLLVALGLVLLLVVLALNVAIVLLRRWRLSRGDTAAIPAALEATA